MSTVTCQDQFEFDYTLPRLRPTAQQKRCKHRWRDITYWHPDEIHISYDEVGCQKCGMTKDGR